MALFRSIRSAMDLPPTGPLTRSAEGQRIDFKTTYPPTAHAEMAKDIAAFANVFGGVILVGTSNDDAPLGYPGLSRAYAQQLYDAFSDAHARHLSPKPPIVEKLFIDVPGAGSAGNVLLAVNVAPFPDQLVGARLDHGWRFPIRVGADTQFLEPAMLPLYTSNVRRTVILLDAVSSSVEPARVCFRNPRNQSNAEPSYLRITIGGLDIQKNYFIVTIQGDPVDLTEYRIPIDDVEKVWDAGTQDAPQWTILVRGHFGGDRRAYHSNPSNTIMRT